MEVPKPQKRLNNWTKTRAKIKLDFEKKGITYCEMCGARNFLSFAHSKKRSDIKTQKDMEQVVLLCQKCHHSIEYIGHQEMYDAIIEIINNRK